MASGLVCLVDALPTSPKDCWGLGCMGVEVGGGEGGGKEGKLGEWGYR